ncbi:50S ribosomal protein L4 [Patescibacteria group bacterium]|nr:50S ribosomal protein L4 [Patescibacteria group bacterium]MBU1703506.1 50S ribosomal protein L4 [Patescibacteria group bacterium]MBU1953413.1 50S ribosomal protein L4 [Patescibacteria group bacterium]
MLKVILYNQKGEKKGDVQVSDQIFGVKYNEDLIHQALLRQLSNARLGMIAHTKTKGEVRGGGRKPFRQKGTGKARQGSTRNPHMPGGGVAMGPRNNRNFKKDMPKKQRRLALFSALSAKYNENKVMAIDKFEGEIKTKVFMEMLHKLPIEKDVLIVIPGKNDIIQKSSNNLPFAKTLLVNYLNIADLQKYDSVLFMEEALKKIEEVFLAKSE